MSEGKIDGVIINGRHLGPHQFRSTNILSSISPTNDGVVLRLDDSTIPAWWLEIYVPKEVLINILKATEEYEE